MTTNTKEPTALPLSQVEKLDKLHDLASFDCGNVALGEWLRKYALMNQAADAAQTYVVHRGGRVVGYFSLAFGSIAAMEAPARVAKGLPRDRPVPVVLLARLAVDLAERGNKLGVALLKDALLRIERAADIAGARAVLVHAIDEKAKNFYEYFGFEATPIDGRTLMLHMKDLRAMMSRV